MIAVVQRVSSASVVAPEADHQADIEQGLVVLLCVERDDTPQDAAWMAAKVAKLRVFGDEEERFDRSVRDIDGAVLLVSQFTLAGDCSKGNRPSFISAAGPELGKSLCDEVGRILEGEFQLPVRQGVFQAKMQVTLVNEGPATFILSR